MTTIVRVRAVLLILALFVLGASPAARQTPSAPADIDAWVTRAMNTFEVPGIALAIVKDGRSWWRRATASASWAIRRRWTRRRSSASRRTRRCSPRRRSGCSSKRGKIEWDAPVVRYLPAFAMWDPFVTRELTVRDLLVHRSGLGLGAGDLLWWPASTYDRKEIARRLRFIPPATSFRSAYAYDNVLYLVAGEVIEADQRPVVGGLRQHAHSREGRHDRQQRAPLRRGARRQRRDARTRASTGACGRSRRSTATTRIRPAASTRRAEDMAKWLRVQLPGASWPTGRGCSPQATARQLTTHRDADSDRRSAAGAARAADRTSTATRSASTSATTAATSSSRTPAGCPATSRGWR